MHLDEELIAFVEGGVSVTLASRNDQLVPSVARGRGCKVLREEPPRLRIYLSAAQAADLLDDVRATGAISVTFCLVSTHRTLQFKGTDARVVPIDPTDRGFVERSAAGFGADLQSLGFPHEWTRAFLNLAADDDIGIEFSPADAFLQTPGPRAGERLSAESPA